MGKSKMDKTIKEVKKDVGEFVDGAKKGTNKAVEYIKDKTK